MKSTSHNKSAFTLIEVLLVVTILGIIAVFAVSQLSPGEKIDSTNRKVTRAQVLQVMNAVEMFKLDTLRYPRTLEELKSNPGIQGWTGPYHRKFTDAFGDPLVYTISGNSYEIRSNAGGTEGGPISSKDDL